MSKTEKLNEEQVFMQEVADDELEVVSGGGGKSTCGKASSAISKKYDCTELHQRYIYEGGFPNCAATVEDGSWCESNDACHTDEVVYLGTGISCPKAWE